MKTQPATEPSSEGAHHDNDEPVYVLITQCLQNDFLFNLNCRVHLPSDAAGKLLIHSLSQRAFGESKSRRTLDDTTLRNGPLGRLLSATSGERLRGNGRGVLHLVNIRDWHVPGHRYDRERRTYGPHCEAGTWGADHPQALLGLLDPGKTRRVHDSGNRKTRFDPRGFRRGTLVVHHVHSNSLFDLERKSSGERSDLSRVLDRIISPKNASEVRVAVIGVYTDIKVQILLQSLRIAYNPSCLVVSDSLTASPTLERHLAALDFAHKVLGVEVMHSVIDLARFLGNDPGEDEELESSTNEVAFADYEQYFRDKQTILTYEDSQLRGYRQQITRRLQRTVGLANFTSIFLIVCGALTLGSSVALIVLGSAYPDHIPVALPAALLGLSALQLVSTLFTRPVQALTQMLGNEAVFRMLLESRSLRLALARHHLTTPQALRGDADSASQAEVLDKQLELLVKLDEGDFDRFERFGLSSESPARSDDQRGSTASGRPT